jgi:alcohol dehydrogenase class IV
VFKFQAKTKVIFGLDTTKQLGNEVRVLNAQKVLVVTDEGIIRAGLLEKVTRSLTDVGVEYAVFDKVEPNPTDATLIAGAEFLKDEKAEAVIGFGGGSPLDAAKGIAVMAVNDGSVEPYCQGAEPWPNTPKPIVAIPTTAGTGSEVSAAAMVNIPSRGMKMALFGPSILPAVAVVDPMLTVGLAPRLTALTGIDALCHAVEAYVCAGANPISDAIAERAIALAADNLRPAFANGNNIEARSNMLLASTMAIIAASNAGGLGIIHSLAQTLGGYYNLPHGLAIAVCFPYGLAYNAIALPEKHAKISQLLGTDIAGMSLHSAAKTVVSAYQELLEDLDIDDNMKSLGLQKADIPKLAEICMLDGSTPGNPRTINAAGFEALYEGAYNASP